MDESGVLEVLHDVTGGLIELNDARIVHRDLKPGNILLSQGRWCLADFGMSRDEDVRTAALTYTQGGTPLYYAPERLRMQPATQKGDLYALRCIGYELAVGTPPFTGSTIDELWHKQLSSPPPAPPG
jgi:serine/threonine-protein kinase